MILGQTDRYIGKTVLLATGVVLLCVSVLTFLFSVVDEAGALSARFDFTDVLSVSALGMPIRIHELVPFVVFLGAVIGLGNLSSRSELTVLRASGTSVFRLFGACVLPVLAVFAASWAIVDFVAPKAESLAVSIKRSTTGPDRQARQTKPFWTRDAEQITGIDEVTPDGSLYGIRQYRIHPNGELGVARFASTAEFDNSSQQWTLDSVSESRFSADGVETRALDTQPWTTQLKPDKIRLRVYVDPNTLSTWGIWQQVRSMRLEGLNSAPYEVALWSSILQPIAILGLILIATGFVVGPLRQVGMGQRLAVGILVGLLFHNVQQFFAPMTSVYGLPAWMAVSSPIAIAWALGLALVRRAR